MKVFVTGATGFIGSHFCHGLHRQGHEVVAMIRSANKARILPEGTELLPGNLDSFKDPNFKIPECDVVVHLAAALPGKTRTGFEASNTDGVKDLVECLQRQKWTPKCLLFTSSLAAAGPSTLDCPHNESAECKPVEDYGRSKLQAEEYLRSIDIPTISFRPPMVVGPNDEAVLPLFKMAKLGIGIRPAGKAQQVSFIAVEDLVEAMVSATENALNATGHKIYFVAHDDLVTNEQVMGTVGEVIGKKLKIVTLPRWALMTASHLLNGFTSVLPMKNPLDESQYQMLIAEAFSCSSKQLQQDTGWKPKHDLKSAMQIAYDGYKKAGWL